MENKPTSGSSFDEYTNDQIAYDGITKDVFAWCPEKTAPYNRVVIALFVNQETKEHLLSFAVKIPAHMDGDEFKDETWMSYNLLKNIAKPVLWTPTYLPSSDLFKS